MMWWNTVLCMLSGQLNRSIWYADIFYKTKFLEEVELLVKFKKFHEYEN